MSRSGVSWRRRIVPVYLLSLVLALAAHGQGLSYFGINNVHQANFLAGHNTFPSGSTIASNDVRYQKALELGFGWNRWVLFWYDVERYNGSQHNQSPDCSSALLAGDPSIVWNWADYEALLDADQQHGLSTLIVLQGVPQCWQAEANYPARLGEPVFSNDSDTPPATPASEADINPENPWAFFVFRAVREFGDRVTYWQVWNEVNDFEQFWPADENTYARLLEVTYLAAKHANPGVHLVMPGWSDLRPGGQPRLEQFLNKLAGPTSFDPNRSYVSLFDVYALHKYAGPWATFEFTHWFRNYTTPQGLTPFNNNDVPIWLTETGINIPGVDAAARASYALQMFSYFRIHGPTYGLEKLFHFQLDDSNQTGLIDATTTPPTEFPMFQAYRLARQYLGDATPLSLLEVPGTGSGFEVLTQHDHQEASFSSSQHPRIVVLWSSDPASQDPTLQLSSPNNTAFTIVQDETTPTALGSNGPFLIDLAPKDNSARTNNGTIGGEVVIYFEEQVVCPSPTPLVTGASWSEPVEPPVLDYSFGTAIGNGRVLPNEGSGRPMTAQVLGLPVVDLYSGTLDLDGSTSWVDVDYSENLLSPSGFQFEALVRRRSQTTEDVIAGQWGTGTARRWLARFVPRPGEPFEELEFRIRCSPRCAGQDELAARWVISTCSPTAGAWHRVAGSYSPIDGLRLFWDGQEVASAPLQGGLLATNGRPKLRLGSVTNVTTAVPARFDGAFDRFRFWGETPELRPDLTAQTPTTNQSVVHAGNLITLTSPVRNPGPTTAESSQARWLINGIAQPPVGLPEIPSGGSVPLSLAWTALEGTHTFRLAADTGLDVEESNENNNTSNPLTLNVLAASAVDVSVTALGSSGSLIVNNPIRFRATLTNAGTASAGSFSFEWTVNGEPLPGGSGIEAGLAPGQTVIREILWAAPTTGTYNVEFFADAAGQIAETREDNNTRLRTVTIHDALPDLRPTAIRYTASEVVPGNVIRIDSGVRNEGEAASDGFNVLWLIDGQDIGARGGHVGVPARSTVLDDNSELYWTVEPGRHTITFVIDDDHQVLEGNEVNNRTTTIIGDGPVSDIDLAPTGITYPAAQLFAGNYIDLNSKVVNYGNDASGSFQVRWIVDGVPVGPFNHTSVDPGQTVDFGNSSLRWQASPGPHTIIFEVDWDNRIAEPQEGNNYRTLILDVPSGPRPDLKAEALRTVGQVRTGSPVTFELRASNLGSSDSGPFSVRWTIDNTVVRRTTWPDLPAGASSVLIDQLPWTVIQGGHTIVALLDEFNQVVESSEGNNRSQVTVSPPLPQTLGTFTVPSTNNVFAAGLGFSGAVGGGGVPQAIQLPTGTGRVLTFSVTGSIFCCGTGGAHGADGGTGLATSISSTSAISGIVHSSRNIFLTGVFLGDGPPASPAPARQAFFEPGDAPVISTTGATSTRLSDYPAPQLQQTFFVGNGIAIPGTTTLQRFQVPDGATRLFLGFADGLNLGDPRLGTPSPADPGYYGDNSGSLTVTIRVTQ